MARKTARTSTTHAVVSVLFSGLLVASLLAALLL